MGIDKTIEAINAGTDLIVQAIGMAKAGGLSLNALKQVMAILGDAYVIFKDANGIMPELKDLDQDEISQLGSLLIVEVKKITSAVAS